MKNKKVPIRKCVACNERYDKRNLIRVVRNSDGEIFLDESGKANGRGCYICSEEKCLEIAVKQKSFNRTFKTQVDDDILRKLRDKIC